MQKTTAKVIWKPQAGSQELFLSCPVFECLYHGTRGPGKTDALLMDFAQFVGRGYGEAWRGIIFRKEYKYLNDIIAKSKKWFKQIFPDAKYNNSTAEWEFKGGEKLYFRHARKIDDYWNYHGHEYPFIGWEELTEWPSLELYQMMMSCCRSSHPGMPRHYRATCNPFGPGHNVVKARFIDPAPDGTIIREVDPVDGSVRERVAIRGTIWENKILLDNDPEYLNMLKAQDDIKRKAWLEGDWNIVAGGFFTDVWDEKVNVIEPFAIPKSWYIDRSFDWGSSHPFSVCWWAESDGSDIKLKDGRTRSTVKGDLFLIAEWYGWNGKPNTGMRMLASEVARKIVNIEKRFPFAVKPGPADSAIWTNENGNCIADDMARQGVKWTKANKSPGSRAQGWELLRRMLKNAASIEEPGLYIFNTCRQFIRTVPTLPRDDKKWDDINTEAEDHIADSARYKLLAQKNITKPLRIVGMGG